MDAQIVQDQEHLAVSIADQAREKADHSLPRPFEGLRACPVGL